jgi:transcriptional regulator GlxA family with amidase domain
MLRRYFLDAFGAASALALVTRFEPELFDAIPASGRENSPDRLRPPPRGPILVAVLVSNGANVVDFTGPWEVFQDTTVPPRGLSHEEQMPFQLFTVADSAEPVRVTGGLRIVPDYTVDNAPPPRVIVVPAMRASERVLAWLRKTSPATDLTMSVCTGAFTLARAGLLKGRPATTHHDFLDDLAKAFPDVTVEKGRRFVESGSVATAGGLTSGIHLALRVVERYFGREVADATARYMEYDRAVRA